MSQKASKRVPESLCQRHGGTMPAFVYSLTRMLACSLIFLTACQKYYYNPAPQILPQYIRKIAVRPIANRTQVYGLEDKLTLAVQNEFNLDGRYQITTEDQADGVLIGTITRYILEPLSYDANHVPIQYKLWVVMDVSFYDKVKNQTLWDEPTLDEQLNYYVASSGLPGSMTEDEAQQQLWDMFAHDILIRTIQGFGTVTGASPKEIPKSSPNPSQTINPVNPTASPPPLPGGPQSPSPTPIPY